MPPDDADLGSPGRWLAYARSDLILARRDPEPGVLLESLCFHAQQAAEKALKALLVHHGVTPPRTHNLTVLLEKLPSGCTPPEAERLKELTAYAVDARYPQGWGEVTGEDYREAVELAAATVEWAERLVEDGEV